MSLPTFAPAIPLEIELGGVGIRHLRLALAMSRLGLITDEELNALGGDNAVSKTEVDKYVNQAQEIVKQSDNKDGEALLTLFKDVPTKNPVKTPTSVVVDGSVSTVNSGADASSQTATQTNTQTGSNPVVITPNTNGSTGGVDSTNLPPQFEMNLNRDNLEQ